jgi:hypothetical protein
MGAFEYFFEKVRFENRQRPPYHYHFALERLNRLRQELAAHAQLVHYVSDYGRE